MAKTLRMLSLLLSVVLITRVGAAVLPEGFEYCKRIIPTLHTDLKYAGSDNFTNQPVVGYEQPTCILTYAALNQLFKVQNQLDKFGLGLKVFDAYRPRKAVDAFLVWKHKSDKPEIKTKYYPDITKKELFEKRFIANYSSHSRGSAVDLTIVDLVSGKELDFGTEFDFFGKQAAPLYHHVSPEQRAHRLLLRMIMVHYGFIPNENEWWHFTLANEPFPNTYFNFDIE